MNGMDLSRQRIVVLGGAGFIGTYVCNNLISYVKSVVSIDVRQSEDLDPKVDQFVGNISDITFVSSVVQGADTVICLSSHSLPGSANSDLAAEVQGHVSVIVKLAELCASNSIKKFIFASSGGTVYGDLGNGLIAENSLTVPINAYGVSKLAIEHYLRLVSRFSEMSVLSLRISNPYGERQRSYRGQGFIASTMQKVLNGDIIEIWGDGNVVRDYVYVKDVADAFLKACSYEGVKSEINIGSGVGESLNSVLEIIGELTGKDIDVNYQSQRNVDVQSNILDVSLAEAELYWEPKISLLDGLKTTHEWWEGLDVSAP
jgi:UDP-glucose 4-epimerase